MQAGGKAGVRLSIGFADQALFIHDQRFRARIGGIPRGVVGDEGHDDQGGFSGLARLFFQFPVVGFRIRKVPGLTEGGTLVHLAHDGGEVPGSVLNDQQRPFSHQALVHAGQQRQGQQDDQGDVAAGNAFEPLEASFGDWRGAEPARSFQPDPEARSGHDQHAGPAKPQEFSLRRQEAAVVLVRADDVKHAHFPRDSEGPAQRGEEQPAQLARGGEDRQDDEKVCQFSNHVCYSNLMRGSTAATMMSESRLPSTIRKEVSSSVPMIRA